MATAAIPETRATRLHERGAARERRLRGAARRRRRALPRRLRRRRRLPLAAHAPPRAGDSRLAGAARARGGAARRDSARADAAAVPERRAVEAAAARGRARADRARAHDHLDRRGLRRDHPRRRGARSRRAGRASRSRARRSPTCAARCSKRTRATNPATATRAGTSRCGRPRAISRSSGRAFPGDVLMRMMGRGRRDAKRERAFPQIDEKLEALLATMAQVLVVEVFAMGTFAWGEALLSDPEVSAAPQQAADLVRFIRSDESPHVEYLRTALSGAARAPAAHAGRRRDRRPHASSTASCTACCGPSRASARSSSARTCASDLVAALRAAGRPESLLEAFEALATPWTPPARTGFEPPLAASA